MQIDHIHSHLFYNHTNIDELDLENLYIVELINRNCGYIYCSLCAKPYLLYNIKYHSNKKHIEYEYYRDISSKS
jgi:hypothetical protein